MIGKIKYALYRVNLNAQNFIFSHEYPHRDVCVIDDTLLTPCQTLIKCCFSSSTL